MISEYAPTKGFLNAANNRVEIVQEIYSNFPVKQEFTGSASKIAEKVGSTQSVVQDVLNILEDKKCLKRTITWDHGKVAHYTLLDERAIAVLKMREYNAEFQERLSIRRRILDILSDGKTYYSVKEIGAKLLENGGRSTDFHSLTHLLHSMQKGREITFETGHSKDKQPYNIRLARIKANGVGNPVIEAPEPPKPDEPTIVAPIMVVPTNIEFPLIQRMISNKARLEAAARLAEEGEAEDISIMLLDRAGKPYTDFEQEVVDLYTAYKACKD